MPGDADCGTHPQAARRESQSPGRLSLSRVTPCVPPRCNQGAPAAATCTSITHARALIRSTPCLRNEKVNLTTTLLTKLLTNPLAQSRSTADSGDQSPASRPDHLTGRLSMAWKGLGSSPVRPACLGGYRIFGRSMHRTLMLEVVGIGGHPAAGGSHCSIPHLKPDKQLLINSQAVYRPSLVENSRVTMSSVEQ